MTDVPASVCAARALQLALAVAAAFAVGFALLLAASHEPVHAFVTLLTGALPRFDWDAGHGWQVHRMARFGAALEDGITLTFLGLAVAIPFRARQFSLGADGAMFLSALASVAVGLKMGGPWFVVAPVALSAALATGFCWGALPALLKLRYGASEIVTSLMLNVIAVEFYRLAITQWLRDPGAGFLVTPLLPSSVILPSILAHTNVSAMLFAAPVAAAIAVALLGRTTVGYEIRVVGDSPLFARRVGLPADRAIILSMAIGGAFAALAGVHVGHALLHRLPVDLNPGMGLDGLIVALLARNEPRSIPLAAFLYAYLRASALAMERTTDVSREVVLVIQAVMILFILAERGRARSKPGVALETP
jgi:simple sugar transport system permease protein